MPTPTRAAAAPASQRQQLWAVHGVPGYFATKAGGDVSSDTSKVWDGGKLRPATLSTPAETANVTLSRPYRPAEHATIMRRLLAQVGTYRTTVSGWDADPELGPIGEPTVYADALLVHVTPPEHDAGSSDAATWELEFSVD